MPTLQDAIDDLYQLTHVEDKQSSSRRLATLSELCQSELEDRGVPSTEMDVELDAYVRSKSWDIVHRQGSEPRIAISTKSILSNLSGTVPNRTDELLGEITDLQMAHPEVVTGYIVVLDTADTVSEPARSKWANKMERRLEKITGRQPPAWGRGMLEDSLTIKTNFAGEGDPVLHTDAGELHDFFDTLVSEYQRRFEVGQQTLG